MGICGAGDTVATANFAYKMSITQVTLLEMTVPASVRRE